MSSTERSKTILKKSYPPIKKSEIKSEDSLSGVITVPYIQQESANSKDYEKLINKPRIENVELIGDKTFEELGLESISNIELLELLI